MKVLALLLMVGTVFAVREPQLHTCLEEPETGQCRAYIPSYHYDAKTGTCKRFIYGGCGGNGNRYDTEKECLKHCEGVSAKQETDDVCSLDKEVGMCLAYFPSFYFDREAGECKKFIYGGCGGNGNNFETIEECQATCSSVQQAPLDRQDCKKGPEVGKCKAFIPRFYYDQEAGICKSFIYGGCGGNRNNFKTEDECKKKCGALSSVSTCEQEKTVGPCKAAFPRYFFNKKTGQCEFFIYGGCSGNDNNFESQEDCEGVCAPRAPPTHCTLEADSGRCRGHFPRYYFDVNTETCEEFIYGGCDGNKNNFLTEDECKEECASD